MTTTFIGLGYRKQSGKDTFAKMLGDILVEHGKQVYVTSFAEPVKIMARTLYGLTWNQAYGEECYRQEKAQVSRAVCGLSGAGMATAREVLQYVGSHMRDSFGENILIDAAFMRSGNSKADVVIIPDVRYWNEVEDDGLDWTVRIDRKSLGENDDTHVSETQLDGYNNWDYEVKNNGTLKELRQEALVFLMEAELL